MSTHFSYLKSRCLIKAKHLGSFLVTRKIKMSFIHIFRSVSPWRYQFLPGGIFLCWLERYFWIMCTKCLDFIHLKWKEVNSITSKGWRIFFFFVKVLVNAITLNDCQACLYITYVCCLVALEMCWKVPSFLAVLLIRPSSTGQAFKFRELYYILKISAWLSTSFKWEPTFFSHQVTKGLYSGSLNETKAVGMEIQQIHYWTQSSISAKDWMQSLPLPP